MPKCERIEPFGRNSLLRRLSSEAKTIKSPQLENCCTVLYKKRLSFLESEWSMNESLLFACGWGSIICCFWTILRAFTWTFDSCGFTGWIHFCKDGMQSNLLFPLFISDGLLCVSKYLFGGGGCLLSVGCECHTYFCLYGLSREGNRLICEDKSHLLKSRDVFANKKSGFVCIKGSAQFASSWQKEQDQ